MRNPVFKGDIKRGTIMFQPLNHSFGVITVTKDCNTNGYQREDGNVIVSRNGGDANIVFPNGDFSPNYPETIMRDHNQLVTVTDENMTTIIEAGIEIDPETKLATESSISKLMDNSQKVEAERIKASKDEQAKFNSDIETMKKNDDFKHLEHMDIGKMHWAKDVAKNVRKDLKKHFPSGKFSVKSEHLQSIWVSIKDNSTDRKEVIELLRKYWNSKEQTPFMAVYGTLDIISVDGY